MESCPHCGSTDILDVEIGDTPADSLMECENCGESFRPDEMLGYDYEEVE